MWYVLDSVVTIVFGFAFYHILDLATDSADL